MSGRTIRGARKPMPSHPLLHLPERSCLIDGILKPLCLFSC